MKTLFKSIAILAASASLALAGGEHWMTDWEAAKAKLRRAIQEASEEPV